MKVRLRFCKTGKIRWTSHRDLARMWERAFRRTGLPLAYSAGFSPRPKVSFGLALSTGHESTAEYLDIELDPARAASLDIARLPADLTAALPEGVDVVAASVLPSGSPSLQHEVTSCRYEIVAAGVSGAQLRDLVARAMDAETLVVSRCRKGHIVTDDVRPAMLSVAVVEEVPGGVLITAEVATQPRGLRPAELLEALALARATPGAPPLAEVRVRRTHQWIAGADGAPEEPLPLRRDVPGAPPAPALERVS